MTGKTLKRYAVSAAMLVLGLVVCSNSYAVITVHTKSIVGMQAPGTDPGVTFSYMSTVYVNTNGKLIYARAQIEGPGVDDTNNEGIWTDVSGSLELVARTGDAVPDMNDDVYFTTLSARGLNDDGQYLIKGSMAGDGIVGTNNWGFCLGESDEFTWILGSGEQAPGAESGVVFDSNNQIQLNNNGHVILTTLLAGDNIDYDNDSMIVSYANGTLRKVVRESDPVPGMPSGVFFDHLSLMAQKSLDSEQTLFRAWLQGDGVSDENNCSIWLDSSGVLSQVMREGDQAPDMAPGILLGELSSVRLSNQGVMGFAGGLTGNGIDESNNFGLWAKQDGEMKLIAQKGDLMPGWARITEFSNINVDDSGHTTFRAVINKNWAGIWSDHSGTMQLLVREGVHAPGTEPDVIFSYIPNISDITSTGLYTIRAYLDGPGVDDGSHYGIWIGDASGNLRLVLREGDTIDINDDPLVEDLRTIDTYPLGLYPKAINNQGVLTFTAYFTDGTNGLFTIDLGLPGDLNGDGFVGLDDLDIVLNNWNQNVSPGDASLGDYNGDGFVGLNDLDAVLVYWNTGTPPNAEMIPEPASMLLLGLALPVVLRRCA